MEKKTPHFLIMALNEFKPTKIYLGVSDGHLVRSFKEPNANTKERITKTGRMVYEQHFKDVTATITSIFRREHDYGEDLCIELKDGEEAYMVQFSYRSRYSTGFLKAFMSLAPGVPVRIAPWAMVDKNDPAKKITGITLYESDEHGHFNKKVLPFYTKEEPRGLPQMEKISFKGKETWDDTKMMDFLWAAVTAKLESKPAPQPATEKPPRKGETINEKIGNDDLPF